MAVPGSGELKLRADIALEVDGSASGTNVSLGTLSDTAGFDTPPDAMSEFYGYVNYVQPTFSGTPSTSNVYDVSMRVTTPSYTNPTGGSITQGFYFGTSTTATSNSFYTVGTSSSTGTTFYRDFTSLSASTTYYAWGVVRDTESPARFTETITSMKTQATGVSPPTYSDFESSQTNALKAYATVSGSATMETSMWFQYDHMYYGFTTFYSWINDGWSGTRYSRWKCRYVDGACSVVNRMYAKTTATGNGSAYSGYVGNFNSPSSFSGSCFAGSPVNYTDVTDTSSGDNVNYRKNFTTNMGGDNYLQCSATSGTGSGHFEIYQYYDV